MMNKRNKSVPKAPIALFLSILVCAASLLFTGCGKEKIIKKKQVILISVDTLRGDHLSSAGYFRDTSPHLSRLIEDSVYYTRAYPNGCWTQPSHMSLLTGTLPSRHGINTDWRSIRNKKYPKLNDSVKNIAEILKTHHIGTIKYARLSNALGFGNGFKTNKIVDPFEADDKFNYLLKELENNKANDFFLFIHTWKVHAPYGNSYFLEKGRLNEEKLYYVDHPFKLWKKGNKKRGYFVDFLAENNLLNPKDCVTLYDGGIHYVDQYIGRLTRKIKELGIYDDVMFIVVSDHGEHFAEHYPKSFYDYHGKDYYEEFINVPLIIKYPQGTVEPGRFNHPVSLIDVLPTILDFYNIDIPTFAQGDSLLKPLKKRKKYVVSEAVTQRNLEIKMIRVGNLKYIITMEKPATRARVNWKRISKRRLYDLKNDPLEKKNLYTDLKYRNLCINFEKMLKKIIKESAAANLTSGETTVDKETLEHMKALGYL